LTNAPVARQRQALVRVTALAIQQEQLGRMRCRPWKTYLNEFTNSAAADVAWLTLGELHLKQHVGAGCLAPLAARMAGAAESSGGGHRLFSAGASSRFPGSGYVGKAQLNLGWCYWVENKFLPKARLAFDASGEAVAGIRGSGGGASSNWRTRNLPRAIMWRGAGELPGGAPAGGDELAGGERRAANAGELSGVACESGIDQCRRRRAGDAGDFGG
jgi:hypothetical protein